MPCGRQNETQKLNVSCGSANDTTIDWGSTIDESLIENESFPEMSLLESTRIEDETPPPGMSMMDDSLSPITSTEDLKPSCCKTMTQPTPPRLLDETYSVPRYVALAKPGGTFGMSRSFADQDRPLNATYRRSSAEPDRSLNATYSRPPAEQGTPMNATYRRSPAEQSLPMNATFRRSSAEQGPPMNATYRRSPAEQVPPMDATYRRYSAEQDRTLNSTYLSASDYTDLGPGRNFQIPENLVRRNIPPGVHRTFPTTHIPQPSRNYSTYEEPQPIMDLREVAEHWRKKPRYYSTPKSESFKGGEGLDQSTLWGQHLSSFDPSTGSSGWSRGVRMDSFNVIRHMTPSPRRVRPPPRMNQTYAAQGMDRFPVSQDRSLPLPTRYKPGFGNRTFTKPPAQSFEEQQAGRTFTQRPQSAQANATFIRHPQTNATFVRRPQTPQADATFSHRPQTPQANATYDQCPQSFQGNATFSSCSPPTNTLYSRSPQAMNETFTRRPVSAQGDTSRLPPCCQTSQRPRTANETFTKSEDVCNNRTCGRADLNKTQNSSLPADRSGREIVVFEQNRNDAMAFDTLLEIRTPRRSGENCSSSPMNLSINVSCAERSIVVTPDRRFNVMDTTPPSCMVPSSPTF